MQIPPKHPTLDLNAIKSGVLTPDGKLLWRSPAWAGAACDPVIEQRLLGYGYQEFVDADDLPALLAFLAKPASSDVCCFGSMIADTGAVGKISLRKLPYGKNWLVVGHFYPDADVNSHTVDLPNTPGFEEPP